MAPRWAWPRSSRLGGTCVIRGCVPKKLMHYGAHFAESFRQASGYGWRLADAPRLDFQALLEARNAEIQRLNGIYVGMLEKAGVTVHVGRALIIGRVGSRFRIEVGGDTVSADRVLVAVGARPAKPAVRGIEHTATSDEILENVYPMPKRLAVVGAGYIGVELASIMNALGVDTRIILRADMPLRGFDEDLRRHMTAELEERGLELVRNTTVSGIEEAGDGFRLETSSGPIEADRVVYATGRPPLPNTSWLGLADLGVAMDASGKVHVDRGYATNVEGIYRRRRLHRPRRRRAGQRPARPHPGRHRRGPGDRRDAVQRQPARGGLRQHPDGHLRPAPGRDRGPLRERGPRRRSRGRRSSRPGSGRCSTRSPATSTGPT